MSRKKQQNLLGRCSNFIFAFAGLALIWQAAAVAARLPFIPSPVFVFSNISVIFFPALAEHLAYSLFRLASAILLSMLIGVPLGLGMGYFKQLDRYLSPAVYLLYPIPKIALLPVVLLLLGLGEASKILVISLIIFFQILVSARDAVKGIQEETFHILYSMGAGQLDILKRIILPASVPNLLTAVRVSLGTALSVLFFTETYGTEHGLGFFIMDSWMRVNYVEMYSGIVVLSLAGVSMFLVLDSVEAYACRWKK